MNDVVGLVLGTDDATPLEFWVAIAPGSHLQLDDVVAIDRLMPSGDKISLYGIVSQVRARHEGARFDSDVFLIASGVLPAEVSEAAQVQLTRVVPETFVPPLPGAEVRRAVDREHLIRADISDAPAHAIDLDSNQLTVVDIHQLHDRAERFVVGVVLRQAFEAKERSGVAKPLQFVVLDELNKYAPRDSSSPIKEILLDVAERGRSLGIILIGAQQTASEVERRVVANSAIRVVGRLDSAEAGRDSYGSQDGLSVL